jgi:hypothetical protein
MVKTCFCNKLFKWVYAAAIAKFTLEKLTIKIIIFDDYAIKPVHPVTLEKLILQYLTFKDSNNNEV